MFIYIYYMIALNLIYEAKGLWQEHRGDRDRLVREGYLQPEDLLRTETWMRGGHLGAVSERSLNVFFFHVQVAFKDFKRSLNDFLGL